MLGRLAAAVWLTMGPPEDFASELLTWDTPPSSPSADTVRQRVTTYATRAWDSAPSTVHATATVRLEEGLYQLSLDMESASGSTSISLAHARCDPLADTTAIKVALAIDAVPAQDKPQPRPASDCVPRAPTVLAEPAIAHLRLPDPSPPDDTNPPTRARPSPPRDLGLAYMAQLASIGERCQDLAPRSISNWA